MERAQNLSRIAGLYFDGLRTKDLSAVPWAEGVILRAPLSDGGAEVPLAGRETVHAYISAILPAIQGVQLLDTYVNATQTAVMGKAELTLVTGAKLRVADLFEVSEAGEIMSQENHFDPRPALR